MYQHQEHKLHNTQKKIIVPWCTCNTYLQDFYSHHWGWRITDSDISTCPSAICYHLQAIFHNILEPPQAHGPPRPPPRLY